MRKDENYPFLASFSSFSSLFLQQDIEEDGNFNTEEMNFHENGDFSSSSFLLSFFNFDDAMERWLVIMLKMGGGV